MLVATLLGSAPAAAAPLCHDLKGLFTPCPPGTPSRSAHRSREEVGNANAAPPEQATEKATEHKGHAHAQKVRTGGERTDAGLTRAHPAKPSLFGVGKLCRDSKGLFTPCPR